MLPRPLIEKVIDQALSRGADFAELFVENQYQSNINFNDSKVKQSIVGRDYGAGIRVIYGSLAIYAYTNDLTEASLLAAADAVSKAARSDCRVKALDLTRLDYKDLHPYEIMANDIAKKEKIELLQKINKHARAYSDKIVQADLGIYERMQHVLIANSEGLLVEDDRHYSRIRATSIAEKNGEMQTGSESPGALIGYEFFRGLDPEELGMQASKRAITMLEADYAPSGKFPAVIDNGFGGVIFHEACGHGLETTSVAKGVSVFSDQLGKKIAHPVVTAIDDGTIPNLWGSENVDDEGMPTKKTVLIEDGILKSFMVDRIGSKKTGYDCTGSGRRESYKFAPASRMRNTFIAPGKSKLDELLASIDYGIYAKKMGGGSVQPGTGNFNFAVAEGYMVRNGKIAEPVRGMTLIGNGPAILHKISMVADNLDFAAGMCGSVSGSVPTSVGQPAVKIDEIVVGGRKEN